MKKILILSACILSAGLISAQDELVTLPDGTHLMNPYILDQTPSTVTIGHAYGMLRIPIKDLPSDYQKLLKYDPAKAASFDKAKAKRHADRAAARKAQKAKEKELQAKADRTNEIHSLTKEIAQLKLRLESDEKRLAKLEKIFDEDKGTANSLAAVQSGSSISNGLASWGRWGIRRFRMHSGNDHAANRAARAKSHQIRRLNDEADAVAVEYTNLDRKIQREKLELAEKEERLEQLKEESAN